MKSSNHLPVQACSLTKRYGALVAVNGIDFTVGARECVGFLGPNGAGKTTTVKMISCFSPVSAGVMRVFGLDVSENPRAVKTQIGICPQEDSLDPDLSVRKNLSVYARYFDLHGRDIDERIDDLLEMVQLSEKFDIPIDQLSGGMKRRLMLARALLNRPKLLILDEPTTGLDPQARHLIWDRVRTLKEAGTSILLTTHYMEEASQLCDRVILMDEGRILLEGHPQDLVSRTVGQEVLEIRNITEEIRTFMNASSWIFEEAGNRCFIYDTKGGRISREFELKFPRHDRLIRQATLEDVFLRSAGRTLKE